MFPSVHIFHKKQPYCYQASYAQCYDVLPKSGKKGVVMRMLDRIALILMIIGALNWGGIGLFQFDAVAWLFGGQGAVISRVIYTLVALAGVWSISLLFRDMERASE